MNINHPMGAARFVRRERYAFPGGYPLVLITTDGGTLCPDCVRENFAAVSSSHRKACDDGWRPAGVMCGAETDSEIVCDHCGKVVQEGYEP